MILWYESSGTYKSLSTIDEQQLNLITHIKKQNYPQPLPAAALSAATFRKSFSIVTTARALRSALST